MNIEDAPFSKLVIKNIRSFIPLLDLYVGHIRFLNYAFVCGVIGVLVNYTVYHILMLLMWEPVAFYAAVGVAAMSNYTFTVGPMGHLFGLSKDDKTGVKLPIA